MATRVIPLGRIFGAPVVVDPWAVVALLALGWLLTHPGRLPDSLAGVVDIVVVAAAVFGSVVWHELAHALAAHATRRRVYRVTVQAFGGKTTYADTVKHPGPIAVIAAAGPTSSGVLGVIVLGVATNIDGHPGSLLTLVGVVNIIVAVFNGLPATPLDGGRVVEAAVWAVSGDRARGMRWAARAGQALVIAIVAVAVAVPWMMTGQLGVIEVVVAAVLASQMWPATTRALRAARDVGRWDIDLSARMRPAVAVVHGSAIGDALRVCEEAGAGYGVVVARTGEVVGVTDVAQMRQAAPAHRDLPVVSIMRVHGDKAPIELDATGEALRQRLAASVPGALWWAVSREDEVCGVVQVSDLMSQP